MHLPCSILLAFSSSIDNLGVAIVFGLREIRLPFVSNLIIAVLTGLGTFISMKAGEYLFTLLPPEPANFLSSGMMIAVGLWIYIAGRKTDKSIDGRKWVRCSAAPPVITPVPLRMERLRLSINALKEPSAEGRGHTAFISVKDSFYLGLALSLSNLAGGIGGGMAGLNPELTALLVVFTSLLFFVLGMRVGHNYFSKWIGDKAAFLAGFVLVAIGIYELFV